MVKSVATSLSFSLLLISASVAFVVADTNVNVEPLFDVAAALNNPPELIKSWKGDNPCRGGGPGRQLGGRAVRRDRDGRRRDRLHGTQLLGDDLAALCRPHRPG
uniref:Uncharacterized protein n=1 Tax=Ananas comosus var. bracteatus TaxID=296719 RepID=A0A6V7PW29_ANACO|nr:unnamed protein product [Ananas comosus var. bracteatus]